MNSNNTNHHYNPREGEGPVWVIRNSENMRSDNVYIQWGKNWNGLKLVIPFPFPSEREKCMVRDIQGSIIVFTLYNHVA